jgi:integrase
MATFTKRGKTWQYFISHYVKGKSEPVRKGGFITKKEAQIAAAEVEANMNKGIMPHLKPAPIDDYFQKWLNLYKLNVNKNTLARYLNTHKTLEDYFKGASLQEIDKSTYQAFLNNYGKKRAKATVRKLNTHVRACVKEAIDEGIIRVDFTRGAVIIGDVPAKRPEEKHLSYLDSKRLMKALYDNLDTLSHYFILLGLTSGMRFAEIVGLTRKDFDFDKGLLTINKSWGYTNKMHDGFGPTKNEQSERIIKMDIKTMTLFKELFAKTPENAQGLVFFSPQSKYKVISNGGVNKALEALLLKLNIEPISVHGLRHTHASILLYKKVSIYYVSERLGHGDIETTNAHYAHIVKELKVQDEKSTIKIFGDLAM